MLTDIGDDHLTAREGERLRGIVMLQAWRAHRNDALPTDEATLAAATMHPARAEGVIADLLEGPGPLVRRGDGVALAGESEAAIRRAVRQIARSSGVPEAALPPDLS